MFLQDLYKFDHHFDTFLSYYDIDESLSQNIRKYEQICFHDHYHNFELETIIMITNAGKVKKFTIMIVIEL